MGEKKEKKIEVEVVNVLVSENHFLVLLKEKDELHRVLPISVGIFEANGIIMALESVNTRRPFTYDIMKTILMGGNAHVVELYIHKLEDNIYYGRLTVEHDGNLKEYDIRPSDGIALSLRFNSDIYVNEEIFQAIQNDENIGRYEEFLNPYDALRASELSDETDVLDQLDMQELLEKPDGSEKEIDEFDEGEEEHIKQPEPGEKLLWEEIVMLKAKMEKAVEEEKYEDAAFFRDKIMELEERLGRN